MFGSLLRCRRGNFAVLTAFALPVMVGAVGVAVDLVHLRQVKTDLQNITDAAVLAATRKALSDEERNSMFEDMLNASLQSHGSVHLLSSSLTIDERLNSLEVTGEAIARIDTLVLGQAEEQILHIIAAAAQSTRKVELTMVLDNTGSMGQGGIDTLKGAALGLLNTIEASGEGKDIKAALVPFVTAVNVKGDGFDPEWIDTEGGALYNGWTFLDPAERQRRSKGLPTKWEEDYAVACKNQGESDEAEERRSACDLIAQAQIDYPHQLELFSASGTQWKGCVEARPYPLNLDLTEPDPAKPDTLFVPYFAPDEPGGSSFTGGNDAKWFNNTWLNDVVTGSEQKVQRSIVKYIEPAVRSVEEGKSLSRGPNRSCPTPIVPLTADLDAVRAGVNAMKFWNGSGTNIAEGLAWGWRVISPEPPYTQAAAHDPENVGKFVVLMTDGRNVSYGASNTINKSDYSSYGFLADHRIAGVSSQGDAEKKLNEWTLEMCGRMKKQGIHIFTVLYKETDKGVQDMFRACASNPADFHMASDTTALRNAFAEIGNDLLPLRLVR
ncbi:pilus assembly protein TadG-related protein [Pararhizobium haloflavum]|uniref:pilus assembly protein TadG-related protein n=1 Tax=Pararhizobium haloflavum TaxID=2037914 RepID=UPI000C191772|nr:pilus assembly protein TadG-related protein [Pararhizobium haloflavum]